LEALTEMRVAEANRLEAIIAVEAVRSSVEGHIAYLDRQIEQTKAAIRQHVNVHPDLRRQSELLDSIPGIAETTAAALLAEITDITQYRSGTRSSGQRDHA
jgi:transposase